MSQPILIKRSPIRNEWEAHHATEGFKASSHDICLAIREMMKLRADWKASKKPPRKITKEVHAEYTRAVQEGSPPESLTGLLAFPCSRVWLFIALRIPDDYQNSWKHETYEEVLVY